MMLSSQMKSIRYKSSLKSRLYLKVNKKENVWNPNIMVNDKWQWYIEFMKQIPKRIINDPPEGWMRPIEMFWELIRFPNTNNLFFSPNSKGKAFYANELFSSISLDLLLKIKWKKIPWINYYSPKIVF